MASNRRYAVKFEENQSKRWDSKEIWLTEEVLDELYDSSKLVDGANVIVPFEGKGGKSTTGTQFLVSMANNKKSQLPPLS